MFEFERYKNRITQEEFIEYFLNFDQFKDIQIKNEDLRIHHKYWLDFFQNIELYENKINEFFMRFDEEIMSYAYNLAKKSFPKTYQFNDFELVFTCGIGQSYGYPYKNSMHFDILQLIKEHKTQEFQYALAHEIHHLFFNQNIKPEEENLEGYFCNVLQAKD